MAKTSPQDAVKKWSQNLSNARPAIEAGVRAVTVAPTQSAANKVDKYQAGVQRAVESGKYQRGLQAVTLQQWQQAMINKGVSRLQNGVKEGESKVLAFMTEFLPYAQRVSDTVRAMPDTTEADREQRMLTNVRELRKFQRTK